jgi:hypothetical protein
MRSYYLATLAAICFSCLVSGCSESPEEAKEKEVIRWLKRWPPSEPLIEDTPPDWGPPYPSVEEWVDAGRKIEEIEKTLIGLCRNNTTNIDTRLIIGALSVIGTADSVPVLIRIMEDEDQPYWTRIGAATALGSVGGPVAVQALCRILSAPVSGAGPAFHLNVVAALGRIGDPNAIPFIEKALEEGQFKSGGIKKALMVLEELKQKKK